MASTPWDMPPIDQATAGGLSSAIPLSESELKLNALYDAVDHLWILLACFFVFSMQIGFAFLEAGGVRAVNVITITFKNLGDCSIGALLWFTFGSKIASPPQSGQGLYGLTGVPNLSEPDATAANLLMVMYLATATTIVSGAVAERITIKAYYVLTVVISAFHYPVVVHWVWASDGKHMGWLKEFGTIDFAGSLVVHMNSGIIAFVAAWILGPRKLPGGVSPFSKEGKNIVTPHNKFLQAAGVMFLWVGWLGFNAGSVPSFTKQVDTAERAAISTVIAGATGAICGMIVTYATHKHLDLGQVSNSLLGALVAVTASCAFITPSVAIFIGMLGSAAYFLSHRLAMWIELDDVVEAASVHAACGLLGTLLVPLGQEKLMQKALQLPDFELNRGEQLGKQLVGVLAVGAWSLFWAVLVCSSLNKFGVYRVPEEHELLGCDGEFFQCYGYDYIGDMMREVAIEKNRAKEYQLSHPHDDYDDAESLQLLGVEMTMKSDTQPSKFKFLHIHSLLSEMAKAGPDKLRNRRIRRGGYESVSDEGSTGDAERASGSHSHTSRRTRHSIATASDVATPNLERGQGGPETQQHPLERPRSSHTSREEHTSSRSRQNSHSHEDSGRVEPSVGVSPRTRNVWAEEPTDATLSPLNRYTQHFKTSSTASGSHPKHTAAWGDKPPISDIESQSAVPVPPLDNHRGSQASLASLASCSPRFDEMATTISRSVSHMSPVVMPGEMYSERDLSEVLEKVTSDFEPRQVQERAPRPLSAEVANDSRYADNPDTDTRDSIYSAPAVCAAGAYSPQAGVRVPPMRTRGFFAETMTSAPAPPSVPPTPVYSERPAEQREEQVHIDMMPVETQEQYDGERCLPEGVRLEVGGEVLPALQPPGSSCEGGSTVVGNGNGESHCAHCGANQWTIHRTRKRPNSTKSHTLVCTVCNNKKGVSVLVCTQYNNE